MSPTLHSLLAGLEGVDAEALDLKIHDGDAMFGFASDLVSGVREQALVEYYRSGHHAWRAVDAALRQALGTRYPRRLPGRLLDFGAGHGRVTRFLLPSLGTGRIAAAETDKTAVDFLRDHFSLSAVRTPADPTGFDLRHEFAQPDGFDVIVALSVLTHLPRRTLEGWLQCWLDALAVEGGVLLFTTRGPGVLLPGQIMPSEGIHHHRISESRVLDLDDYGTTWVTPNFMGRTLDRLTGGLARWQHLPLGLWNLQDLWLVTLDPRVDWGQEIGLAVDQPTGSLEHFAISDGQRCLDLSGWAVGGRRPPRGAAVELLLGGEVVARTESRGHREDTSGHLGLAAAAEVAVGFELRHELPEPLDPSAQIRIDLVDDAAGAGSATGRRYVLHAGSLEATEMFQQLRQMRRDADHYRNQVEIFEASRWGKLRRAWMALKDRLG